MNKWDEQAEQSIRRAEDVYLQSEKKFVDMFDNAKKKIIYDVNLFFAKNKLKDPYVIYSILNDKEMYFFKKFVLECYDKSNVESFKNKCKKFLNRKQIQLIEKLLFEIDNQIENVYYKIELIFDKDMEKIFTDTYYNSIYNIQNNLQIGFPFAFVNKENKSLKEKWFDKNYLERLLSNKIKLIDAFKFKLTQSILVDQDANKTNQTVTNQIKTGTNNIKRLSLSEYLHAENEANYLAMKNSGVKKYKYCAILDYKTSDICRHMNNKVFELSKKKVGINFPPLHGHCRSTTIPYFDKTLEGQQQEEIAFQEWLKKYKINV